MHQIRAIRNRWRAQSSHGECGDPTHNHPLVMIQGSSMENRISAESFSAFTNLYRVVEKSLRLTRFREPAEAAYQTTDIYFDVLHLTHNTPL
jgi:hypothetical protein